MIRTIVDISHNIYSVISVVAGSVSGVVIAVLNSKSRHRKEIDSLHIKMDAQKSQLDGLKKAFSIVYDAYERDFRDDPNKLGMLKDLKKEYDL